MPRVVIRPSSRLSRSTSIEKHIFGPPSPVLSPISFSQTVDAVELGQTSRPCVVAFDSPQRGLTKVPPTIRVWQKIPDRRRNALCLRFDKDAVGTVQDLGNSADARGDDAPF